MSWAHHLQATFYPSLSHPNYHQAHPLPFFSFPCLTRVQALRTSHLNQNKNILGKLSCFLHPDSCKSLQQHIHLLTLCCCCLPNPIHIPHSGNKIALLTSFPNTPFLYHPDYNPFTAFFTKHTETFFHKFSLSNHLPLFCSMFPIFTTFKESFLVHSTFF